MSLVSVTFGTFAFTAANGVWVTDTDVDSAPAQDVQIDELAEHDGGVVVQTRFKEKRFTVNGIIRADSQTLAKQAKDAFKAGMAVRLANFDYSEDGVVRRYVCSAENIVIAQRGITSYGFSVAFVCPTGVGMDTSTSTLMSGTAISTSTASVPISVQGSYRAEPLITLTFSSVSGATTKTVKISNGTTLRGITVQRTWANGDVLAIDASNRTIYVNNVAVDFNGQFPYWDTGNSTLEYLDDFTSRSATVAVSYTRRWL